MNAVKHVYDLLEPVVECGEIETLGQVLSTVTQGKPVAVRSTSWRLLLPETVIGYPLSRRVIDLPLADVPVVPPELSAEEALTSLHGRDAPYALVVGEKQLFGVISRQRLQEYGQFAERERAEETFKASLKQQEVLLREAHHRIKNNMQIISSLLDMQASSVEDPHIVEMFMDVQNRVLSMALIHETLYQSGDFRMVNFGAYVRTLAEQIVRSYNALPDRIALQIRADEVMLDTNQAIPCGLILNELLSNCLKHAFPDERGGEISIELRSDAAPRVTLIVRDTGVGLPARVESSQSETLGLLLVHSLTEQVGGTLETESHDGTTFTLSFTASPIAIEAQPATKAP
jgi:two-component sensor histidine kinase